jgi:predicted acetyltransferase
MHSMTEEVALEIAQPHDAPLLANLIELYVHDLSEVFPVELGPGGRFGYDRLPRYWTEPELRFPFLIRAGDRIAGFALATRGSAVTNGLEDLDVAEFFVLRSHRRSRVRRAGWCRPMTVARRGRRGNYSAPA